MEIIKFRAEISELESQNMIQKKKKIYETKSWFTEKLNKIDNQ